MVMVNSSYRNNIVEFPRPASISSDVKINENAILKMEEIKIVSNTDVPFLKQKLSKERSISMDWQEKYIDSLDKNVRDIKTEISTVKSEIKAEVATVKSDFDNKINQFMTELRDRDNQRHKEIIAMQQRVDESLKEIRTDIKSTQTEMRENNKWVKGLIISTGIALFAVTVTFIIGMFTIIRGSQ